MFANWKAAGAAGWAIPGSTAVGSSRVELRRIDGKNVNWEVRAVKGTAAAASGRRVFAEKDV